jgi:uncharacterized protein (DUF2141 family)|tara:strand:- start:333 stop:764 length:432 start_codon:yes stop_codon:yes gene_type:complete
LKNLICIFFFFLFSNLNNYSLQNYFLEIEIPNIKENGTIYIAIYDNAKDFNSGDESQEIMAHNIIEPVSEGVYIKKILLEKGDYAVKVLVDSNGNGDIDFNFLGFPKEQYGFSNNVIGLFSEPNFDKASVEINENKKIIITLR